MNNNKNELYINDVFNTINETIDKVNKIDFFLLKRNDPNYKDYPDIILEYYFNTYYGTLNGGDEETKMLNLFPFFTKFGGGVYLYAFYQGLAEGWAELKDIADRVGVGSSHSHNTVTNMIGVMLWHANMYAETLNQNSQLSKIQIVPETEEAAFLLGKLNSLIYGQDFFNQYEAHSIAEIGDLQDSIILFFKEMALVELDFCSIPVALSNQPFLEEIIKHNNKDICQDELTPIGFQEFFHYYARVLENGNIYKNIFLLGMLHYIERIGLDMEAIFGEGNIFSKKDFKESAENIKNAIESQGVSIEDVITSIDTPEKNIAFHTGKIAACSFFEIK